MPAERSLESFPSPLKINGNGVVRIGETRITLETLVSAFDAGATPEEIVQQYPSVDLGTVYAAIACVIRNRDEVDEHLAQRAISVTEVRAENERRFPPAGIRQRLMARRARIC
jgi:uncharacterized protein (DUF433 family)